MLYFHDIVSLSPADNASLLSGEEAVLKSEAGMMLTVSEPAYPGIPPNVLRRMGKCVRMCVGLSLPLIQQQPVDGIIIGTANGGMEDCIKFLNQIIEYDEGKLTPGNFVQSTANGPAAQIALVSRNRQYNITHVHRGLAFEQSLLDAVMLLKENPGRRYLVGAVDEISEYNFNIDRLAGWFREQSENQLDLFRCPAPGTIAGEGALSAIVSADPTNAKAVLRDLQTMHTTDAGQVESALASFLTRNNLSPTDSLLLISGENGDTRFEAINTVAERKFFPDAPVLRYKDLVGEYATATSFALWLAVQLFSGGQLPQRMMKRGRTSPWPERILIVNAYRGFQHSFILLEKP